MYHYEEIKGTILADGCRYSPRIHRQYLPFKVLQRIADDLKWDAEHPRPCIDTRNAIMYAIHGIREIDNAPHSDKATLTAIWEDAFVALVDVLQIFGVEITKKPNDCPVDTLRRALRSIGYDSRSDSFYTGTNATHFSINALANCLSYPFYMRHMKSIITVEHRVNRKLDRCRHGMFADKLSFLARNSETWNRLLEDFHIISRGAVLSGYYYTMRYFVAFAPRFKLSDIVVARMTSALAVVTSDITVLDDIAVLVDVYNELKQHYYAKELPVQLGLELLFERPLGAHTTDLYTNVFN